MNKRILIGFVLAIGAFLFIGAAGDVFKAVMTDSAGNVVSTPLSFSNNVTQNATPSGDRHLARMQDITNAAVVADAVTNVTGDTSILVSGTRVKALTWSNANGYVTKTVNDLDNYILNTGAIASGNYLLTNNAIAIGSNDFTHAKLFINGESGIYTNKPLISIHRSASSTGPFLEWERDGVLNGVISNNGAMYIYGGLIVTGYTQIPMAHFAGATTNTLTTASGLVSNIINFTAIDHTYNFTHSNGQIKAKVVGTFELIASGIFKATTNEGVRACLWFRTNNVNMAGTATYVDFPTTSGAGVTTNLSTVVAVPIIWKNATTNDFIELLWWGSDASVQMPDTPAATTPARPSCPAMILNIKKISGGDDN